MACFCLKETNFIVKAGGSGVVTGTFQKHDLEETVYQNIHIVGKLFNWVWFPQIIGTMVHVWRPILFLVISRYSKIIVSWFHRHWLKKEGWMHIYWFKPKMSLIRWPNINSTERKQLCWISYTIELIVISDF